MTDKRLAEGIGRVARGARTRAGLTQAEMGERLGIATEVYGRIERGTMLPSVVTFRKLAVALSVPSDALLDLGNLDASEVLPPPPGFEESPDIRRLARRVRGLPRRKLRMLNVLARMLAPGGGEATPAEDVPPGEASPTDSGGPDTPTP